MNWDRVLNSIMDAVGEWGPKILGVFIALFLAWVIAGWLQRTVRKRLAARNFDPSVTGFFASLLRYGILTAAIVGCLGVFGIETTSFAAVFAAAGLAIGLAFQGTLSNFAAGVMLLVFRPFKVNDLIETAGETGTVEVIDLFTTELKTLDNRRIIVPNSAVFGNTIENFTYHPIRRIAISVGTDYGADLDEVRAILEKVPPTVPGVIEDPEPQIFLEALGASSIDWQVRVWCNTPDYWDVHQATILATKKALDDAGIGIPFPQRDVHLDKEIVEAISSK